MAFATAFSLFAFLPPAAPRPWNWRPGSFVRKIPPPRTCASGLYRRERSSPPPGANCLGCNPRARALSSCTGAAFSRRPRARIDSGGPPPRTCASGSMSTSEASVSPAGSVGPGRSPLGTRTPRRESSRAATRRDLTEMQPPPRTSASGSMSTSEASVSPAGSVGPGRSPLGTRTPRRESSRAATRRELRAQALGRARALTVR